MARVWPTALVSAGAGAYGLNAMQNTSMPDLVRGFAGSLIPQSGPAAQTSTGSSGEGMSALQKEVERLQQLLSDVIRGQRSGGPQIIYRDGRGGSGWLIIAVPCALGITYLYFRLRGWQIGDLMYVTRGSIATLRSTVTDNFTRIWDYMSKQKEEFVSRFSAIGQQQERLIVAQNDMDVRLREVGVDVTGIAGATHRIEGQVESLDGRMSEVDTGVKYANQGIMLLCQAMSDITHRLNFNVRSADALKSYAQTSPLLTSQASFSGGSGLRNLLGGASTSSLALLPPPEASSGASSVPFPPLAPAAAGAAAAPALSQYGRPPCLTDSSPSSTTSSSAHLTPPLPPRSGPSLSMSATQGPVSGGGGGSGGVVGGGPPNFSIGGRAMSALGSFFPRNGGAGSSSYTEDAGHMPLPKARTSSVIAS